MEDIRSTINRSYQQGIDPDPIAILTVCFSGVAMVSAVSSTILQLLEGRRRKREDDRSEEEAFTEIQIAADRVVSSGHRLHGVIEGLNQDATLVPKQASFIRLQCNQASDFIGKQLSCSSRLAG